MPTLYTIIRRPLITEKGLSVKETEGTLVFDVAPEATKTEVKQAVEALFKVKVSGVRTANVVARNAAAASLPATSRTGRRLTCG
jgi:large subunit ribosomal protein L23